MPETNPRQGGLHTDLDQTSVFWRFAAAEGYLPGFQDLFLLSTPSYCTVRVLQQDEMA